ncbi:hypothetical protein AOLI_G00162460 [Acnodon oligacanthus]
MRAEAWERKEVRNFGRTDKVLSKGSLTYGADLTIVGSGQKQQHTPLFRSATPRLRSGSFFALPSTRDETLAGGAARRARKTRSYPGTRRRSTELPRSPGRAKQPEPQRKLSGSVGFGGSAERYVRGDSVRRARAP